MHETELGQVFHMYQNAAESGEGIGAGEFPNIHIFKQYFFDKGHVILVTDSETSTVMAAISVVPSGFCRSVDPPSADSYILVYPEFRGEGVGVEAGKLVLRFAFDLGYKGFLSDSFLVNDKALGIMRAHNLLCVGYIPRAAYVQGIGWSGSMIVYGSLLDTKPKMAKL